MVFDNNCIFRPLDIKVSFVSIISCTTLEPNGKFCMGLTSIEGIERLE